MTASVTDEKVPSLYLMISHRLEAGGRRRYEILFIERQGAEMLSG